MTNIVSPLTSLLSKSKHWIWGQEEQVAFDNIKQALTTAPVLLIPDFTSYFRLKLMFLTCLLELDCSRTKALVPNLFSTSLRS